MKRRADRPHVAGAASNAEHLTVHERQQIIPLVVREVLIGEDDVTIRHSIRVPTGDHPRVT
jgi:site-specific DNA recombinase